MFGHFGVKRIYSIFTPHYHLRGMYVQICDIIVRCEYFSLGTLDDE
jgi:hypothetical protein